MPEFGRKVNVFARRTAMDGERDGAMRGQAANAAACAAAGNIGFGVAVFLWRPRISACVWTV